MPQEQGERELDGNHIDFYEPASKVLQHPSTPRSPFCRLRSTKVCSSPRGREYRLYYCWRSGNITLRYIVRRICGVGYNWFTLQPKCLPSLEGFQDVQANGFEVPCSWNPCQLGPRVCRIVIVPALRLVSSQRSLDGSLIIYWESSLGFLPQRKRCRSVWLKGAQPGIRSRGSLDAW